MSTIQLQHNIASGLGILWEALLFKVFINVLYKYVGVGNSYAQPVVGRLEPVWTVRTHSLVEK